MKCCFSTTKNQTDKSSKIREPRQKRSIEKKNRIIEASYALFSEVGYYGTNTAEIAKKAGVSTVRIHTLIDGRDVGETSALDYINPFEEYLASLNDATFNAFSLASAPLLQRKSL